jgi:hypothetical protein
MTLLPAEFADLEPFAQRWCLATEAERWAVRMASTMPEMQEFYDAVTARAEDAMSYLEQFPLDELPDTAMALLHLLYSMIMVSFPIEVWTQPRVPNSGSTSLGCIAEPVP